MARGRSIFAAELGGGVFEIYPQTTQGLSTLGTRVGFAVPSVDAALEALGGYPDAVMSAAKDSEWGNRLWWRIPTGIVWSWLKRRYESTKREGGYFGGCRLMGGSTKGGE